MIAAPVLPGDRPPPLGNSKKGVHDENDGSLEFNPKRAQKEHTAPSSPLYLVILKGRGMFAGGDGKEHELGPNSLIVLDQGEAHAIRALDQDLVFVGFMHGETTAREDKVAGKMADQ